MTITKRQCCTLNPCLKPHWNFAKKGIQNIHWFVGSYTFHIVLIYQIKYWQICSHSYLFYTFLYTGTTSAHLSSSEKKSLSKHSLKFSASNSLKMSLNSLIILSGISMDFETVLESNRLITMDICSLSIFLKVKVEFNYVHLWWLYLVL